MSQLSLARLATRFTTLLQPLLGTQPRKQSDSLAEADQCYGLRHYLEAEPLYIAALEQAQQRRADATKKFHILIRLCECQRRAGKWDQAEEAGHQALMSARTDAQRFQSLDAISRTQEARGETAGAVEFARRAFAMATSGKLSPSLQAEACARLATLEQASGNAGASRQLLRDSIPLFEAALGPHHPHTATQVAALATALQEDGHFTDALPLFEQALSVHQAALGANAPESQLDLEHLGQIHYLEGRLEQAADIYSRLVRLKESTCGLGHIEHATFLIDAATVHQAAGQTGRAVEYLYNARQKAGRDAKLGPVIEERLNRLSAEG